MRKITYTIPLIALILAGCNTNTAKDLSEVGAGSVTSTPMPQVPEESDPENELPETTPEPTLEDDAEEVATQEKSMKKVGWYMRTTIEAKTANGNVYKHNTAGVFGEYRESCDGKDKHDIPSYGKALFQVRFVNQNLSRNQDYFSDYRQYHKYNTKQTWTFQVVNEYGVDLSNENFKIEVEHTKDIFKKKGVSKYLERMSKDDKRKELTLIDLDHNISYDYKEVKNTIFNMDGKHVRTFKWVLGDANIDDLTGVNWISRPTKVMQKVFSKGFGLPPE